MQVEDDLSSPPAAVNDQAVARLNFVQLSHAFGCKNHLGSDADRLFVQGIKRVDMGSGNDQQVTFDPDAESPGVADRRGLDPMPATGDYRFERICH